VEIGNYADQLLLIPLETLSLLIKISESTFKISLLI